MRRWLPVISALFVALGLAARPARPGGQAYVQPDGSVLEIFLHGDEWGHWVTDAEGRLLEADGQGFYRLSERSLPQLRRRALDQSREMRRRTQAQRRAAREEADITHGTHRVPVLLIEFADNSFSVPAPRTAFTNLLSQKGYDLGGATGSAWDYFNDNSHGQYNPVFDVYGPVKLSKTMASYGKNDTDSGQDAFPGPELALVDAAVLLDETVDFSQYDEDGDGEVDMILYYFAGYDEAEGGPSNAIWSHQWDVQNSSDWRARNTRLDGVRLGPYICTSELQGSSGTRMVGIGGTVHELGHYLGLPDFYDADGDDNGFTSGLYSFSAMSYGLYNNSSHTPPRLNMEELLLLDWAQEDALQELEEGGYALGGIQEGTALRIPTSMKGEYFLLECRDGTGWDAPLPQGLAVYHVDKSNRPIQDGFNAIHLWAFWRYFNNVNSYGDHPCFYIVASARPFSLNLLYEDIGGVLFPGNGRVTTFQPIDWDGIPTDLHLADIAFSGGRAWFSACSGEPGDSADPEVSTLDKTDPSARLESYSASGNSLMGAVRFSADELSPYQGQRLSSVTFYPVVYSAEAIQVLVECGGQRLLTHTVGHPVYNGWNTVDIGEYDLRVPSGEDLLIGYAVKGGDYDHPLSCRSSSREDPSDSYYAAYSEVPVPWQPMKMYDLALSATVSEVKIPSTLADLSWNSIDPGSGEYRAGDTFRLHLKEALSRRPSGVAWFFDGASVDGNTVTLSAGEHTVEAHLRYENGSTEILELEIFVE